jgi:sulfoacetaldehyde acetyltransferase
MERIAELTHRAFTIALAERGPVQINVPRDYFLGDIDTSIFPAQRIERGPGDDAGLDEAAKLLAEAEFPVILVGGGAIMAEGCGEALELAEHLQAPVVTSYLHNDAVPASHPLMCGPLGYQGSKTAMRVIAQADAVLALGSRLGPFGTLPQYGIEYWPENAKVIQIDADHRVLGLVKSIAVGIHGDAKAAAVALLARLRAAGDRVRSIGSASQRLAELERQRKTWEQELDELSSGDGSPIPARRALRELERAMPRDAMVATDIGNVCSVSNSYLRFDRPQSFFAAMAFGNCGYAFPTAIGARVAQPDRPSVAYVGDGAWGMSLAEVLTCVRERIPVTAVVFNNGQWGAEKRNQIDYYAGRFPGTDLENPSFARIAQAMGADGITVDHPDQVGDALRKATSSGQCTVLELMLNDDLAEPFRRDALRKPVRRLDKYKHYTVR